MADVIHVARDFHYIISRTADAGCDFVYGVYRIHWVFLHHLRCQLKSAKWIAKVMRKRLQEEPMATILDAAVMIHRGRQGIIECLIHANGCGEHLPITVGQTFSP